MKTLKSMCVSLELAKQMKELGFKQESYFSYLDGNLAHKHYLAGGGLVGEEHEKVSAYISDELGVWLPKNVTTNGHGICTIDPSIDGVEKEQVMISTQKHNVPNTEANGRALMLIHLAKNGLIDPKKV